MNITAVRSPILGITMYVDMDTQEVFTTLAQAAIACYTSQEDLMRDLPYRPTYVAIGPDKVVKVSVMQLTNYLHKYRPSVLSACVASTVYY